VRAQLGDDDLSGLAAEHAALRRVAALVARGAPPEEVFAAGLEEVGRLLAVDYVHMARYEPDQTLSVVASWGSARPVVARTALGGENLGTIVFETGRSARIEDYAHASGTLADGLREQGIRSAVGTPITVEGRLWGLMAAGTRGDHALPADAESRLASFTELLATTIANAESRAGVTRLAADQAALRRVATLVARAVPREDVFAAVVEEVGRLLPVDFAVLSRCEPDRTSTTYLASWGTTRADFPVGARVRLGGKNATTLVAQTGRPVRIESYEDASGEIGGPTRALGVRSAIGTPITVEGQLWGVLTAGWSLEQPMPADTEPRLAQFTDLLETAIANAESRAGLARLAEEQAALRRVATLVARGVAPEEVFAAVTEEVGRLLPVDFADMSRVEPDGAVTFVAAWGVTATAFPIGSRWIPEGNNLCSLVAQTGRPARIESYADAFGPIDAAVRDAGVRSAVGTPIIVDGRLWGVMAAGSRQEEPMPAGTEARLTQFTELLATAVANAESRAGLARLADEQAALRRVATLVARRTRPEEVFAAVADEVGKLLSVELANVIRYESDATVTFVASAGERVLVGSRWPLGETNLATLVLETGRPARLDNYADAVGALAEDIREQGVRSAVGTPIVVEGRLWGLMAAGSSQEHPLAPDTEARLARFTELVATAIANTEARTEVGRLLDEQAALRRVATLVAEGAPRSDVFATVTREVGILCGADLARMERYESADSVIGVAGWSTGDTPELALGTRLSLEGPSIAAMVHEASRPVRVDSFADAHGPIAQEAQRLGIRSSVGCPIVVDGRLWGVIAASSKKATPFPPDTESRIAEFTELVATAIANAEARTEVAASRARLAAATDDERRRVVRDLHDGAQQGLVHTIITLKLASQALERERETAPALVHEALDHAERAKVELRELAHGILPTVLTKGGLQAVVSDLASRTPVPVAIDVSVDRLPAAVEATAYFVVAEALTNVAKHASADQAEVMARIEDGTLAVRVRDDGVGGARPDGSGLMGLADRLAALDGRLRIESPSDGGTLVAATIPLPAS
jgi:GAF domain-containing protein